MHRRHFVHASLLTGSTLAAGSIRVESVMGAEDSASAEDWPCWRGPSRDGVCAQANFPRDLASLKKRWSIPLADSYSGPIVHGEQVFTTETVNNQSETILALDQATGDTNWKQAWEGAMSVPFFAKANGDWIRSTPATNGKYLVVGGMRDVLACFEVATGREVWRIDFVAEHGATLPAFGLVCSPLIEGDFVYVQAGGAVRQIRLADGELGWAKVEDTGGMSGGAFSSPVLATIHGVPTLVVQTRTTLCGLELSSGELLWQQSIASFRGMNILTPTVWKDCVFTSCYGGRAQLFRIPASGDALEAVWEGKAEAYMSSPVIVDDHLYMHLKNKRISCLDLATGEERWRTTPFGKYWSMVTDGTKILALDERGELLLVSANPSQFELLDRREISDEPSWAHIAVAGKRLYVRRQHGLDAYDWA